jgi:hypothetical protein
MEELMRKVSENRARTIDKLVADARAAKAEAIANTLYVPLPGEEVPGMQPINSQTESRQEEAGDGKGEEVLEKALEKAKETAKKRPRKITKSETQVQAAAKSVKAKVDEEVDELTFDDVGADLNKAAKKKTQ